MKTTQVHIAVHQEDALQVALRLSEIEEADFIEPPAGNRVNRQEAIDSLKEQMGRLDEIIQALQLSEPQTATYEPPAPEEDLRRADRLLKECKPAVEEWQRRKEQVDQAIDRLQRQLDTARELGFFVSDIRHPKYLNIRLGWIHTEEFHRISLPVFRTPVVLIPIYEKNARWLTLGATVKDRGFILDAILKSVFYEPVEIFYEPGDSRGIGENPEKRLGELKMTRDRLKTSKNRLGQKWQKPVWNLALRLRSDVKALEILDHSGSRQKEMIFLYLVAPEKKIESVVETAKRLAEKPHAVFAFPPAKERR